MIDSIKFQPDRLFLTEKAAGTKDPVPFGFSRTINTTSGNSGQFQTLAFEVDRYKPVRIIAKRLDDHRLWIKSIEANLPALLHGHNGRQLASASDLFLSLTRLRHIVSMVVEPHDYSRIVPGLDRDNQGWIRQVECFRQFEDPEQQILRASHFCRLSHQQKPNGVYYGESTRCITRKLKLQFYDKQAEMYRDHPASTGNPPTRMEVAFLADKYLAEAVVACGQYEGNSGSVVATLSAATVNALINQTLTRVVGFGWMPDRVSLASLCKPARQLAIGLQAAIHEPHRLDHALAEYRLTEQVGDTTFRRVEKDLRAYAVLNCLETDEDSPLEFISGLPPADVTWPQRENEYARILRDVHAPEVPDDDIARAWSHTTLLSAEPAPCEIIGQVAPGPLPWIQNSLS